MSRKEYEIVLNHHNIPKNTYAIGEKLENRVCFTNENDKWQVFKYKNQQRYEMKEFAKEIEACAYFFQVLLIDRELSKAGTS